MLDDESKPRLHREPSLKSVCGNCTQRNCKLPKEMKFFIKSGIKSAEIIVLSCTNLEEMK